MPLYRHGDVLMEQIEHLPNGIRQCSHMVLAYGESTGHSHRIADPSTASTFELDGQLFLKVIAPSAKLIHEEHDTIDLPQGIYRVWQQREYTPGEIRRIYD
jgi:hypothetical protein